MIKKKIKGSLRRRFSRKFLYNNLQRGISQLSAVSRIYPTDPKETLRYWMSERSRHALIPVKNIKYWKETLGLRKGEKVLFPCSYSCEWAHLVGEIVGKKNVVALDFSEVQLRRAKLPNKVLGIVQELPFRNKSFDKVITFEPTPLVSIEKKPVASYYTFLPTLNEFHRVGKEVIILGRKTFLDSRALKEYALQTRASYKYKLIPISSKRHGRLLLPTNKYAARKKPVIMFKFWGGDYMKQKEISDTLKKLVKESKI